MYYCWEVTTPKNTSEINRISTPLLMEMGTIDHVEIQFPPGPSGLLHVRISDGIHQVWPKNTTSYFAGDDQVIPIDDEWDLTEAPYTLTLESYNTDDTYDHEIIVRISIKPVQAAIGPPAPQQIPVPEEFT